MDLFTSFMSLEILFLKKTTKIKVPLMVFKFSLLMLYFNHKTWLIPLNKWVFWLTKIIKVENMFLSNLSQTRTKVCN